MRTSSIRAALLLLGATALFTAGCGDDDTPMEDGGPVTDGGRDGGTDGGTDAGRDAQVTDDGGEDAAAPDCEEATDCEGTDTTCRFRTCVEGACGFENASARTACTEDEGSLCDGEGACVECLNVDDCGEGEVCDDTNACVPTACMNGVLDGEETDVDCGGPDCGPCGVGDACLVASDCESRFCDESGDSPVCAACGSDDDCSGDEWCDVENERCEPTTCAAESCAVAPMAICSEGAAITYEAAGTCTSPGGVVTCEHAVATTTDCAAADQACVEGACVDPCATTTCDAPPAADCVDPSTRRTYATTGVCASPGGVATCTYEATTTTCEGTTSCLEGVCVDGCDGVSCAVAPAPECIDGTTLRTFTAPGTCGIDEGTPSCTFPSTTTDCADGVPGGTCAAGACVDPCATVTCDAPPPDDCDGTSRRTYAATGTCSAGTCTYEPTLESCADVPGGTCTGAGVCVNACTPNPCTDATSFCVDQVVTTQVTPGTCAVTSEATAECTYATMAGVDCTTLDQQCSAGACIDPCVSTACDTPPGDFCDTDGVAVTHAGGVCTSPGGVITCSYPETRVDCPGAGLACVGAACVDLCEGVSCDTLPPPTCVDEDTERVAAASGSCTPSTGECSFMMMDVTCDSGSTCVEGQGCVAPPTVVAISPADGATTVPVASPLAITFSAAMDPTTLTATTTLDGACTGSIQVSTDGFASCIPFAAATPTMSVGDTVATLVAAPGLAFGTTFAVRVTTSAESATGAALATRWDSTFTTELPPCENGSVVISQVYGGGGNSGAPYTHDFVEIHNRGRNPVTVGGWSVQYASAAGTSWSVTPLSGMIQPGGFHLVRLAGGATGVPLPMFDSSGTANVSATNGKVALVASTAALSGGCPTSTATLVDFVGFGTADCALGTAAPAGSNQNSIRRRDDACRDSANNADDFAAVAVDSAPGPRNSDSAPVLCCSGGTVNETGEALEADFCNVQFPASVMVAAGAPLDTVYGRIYELGVTDTAPNPSPEITAEIGIGPRNSNPQWEGGWTYTPATYNLRDGNDEEYQVDASTPAAGEYSYVYRFSLDGGASWTYCDLNGAGSNGGLSFETTQLPRLLVTP
ncbi:MAG: lamin tail domain-containing protein [Myxococcales bacterium]|nr:lamin tail domain-containing protein [Myxococcales bacterium]